MMTVGFINCDVITLTGRSKTLHGFMVKDAKLRNMGDYDTIMEESDSLVNLKGFTVLPGFIDSHTHLLHLGLGIDRVDLSDTDSFKEAKYYLQKSLDESTEDEWIIGHGFDETRWKRDHLPSKSDLDDISDNHPILIKRVCGHIAVANSMALEEFDSESKFVDADKGIIKEDPLWNLDDIIGVSLEDKKEAIEKAIKKAHSLGITGIHEIMDRDAWEAYKSLDEEKGLDLRVRGYVLHEESEDLEPVENSEHLSLRGVKIFVDGSLGGKTAALTEDYEDDPGNKGELLLSADEIEDIITDAEERGFQVMAHAIGDRAISSLLDAYESASQDPRKYRHRIEHGEMVDEVNTKRIRNMGLILSVQPNFAYNWSKEGGMNEKRLGKERLQKCNPFWDIQRSLVKMAFGSDTMPMSPMYGVYSATHHPILEQRISVYNALQSYISNSAYAGKDEEKLGELRDGMYADFTVLSENPLKSENLRDIEVIMTVVNGKIVYDSREE